MSADSGGEASTPTATRGTDRTVGAGDASDPVHEDATPGASAADADDAGGFGRRGWALVAAVVCSTLVIPGVIYLVPTLLPSLGVPYVLALLVLPLVPAGVLGATAVWSMAASGRR